MSSLNGYSNTLSGTLARAGEGDPPGGPLPLAGGLILSGAAAATAVVAQAAARMNMLAFRTIIGERNRNVS